MFHGATERQRRGAAAQLLDSVTFGKRDVSISVAFGKRGGVTDEQWRRHISER